MSKELILEFSENDIASLLFGEYNDHLSYLEKKLDINISDRGNLLRISGDTEAVSKAQVVLQSLETRLKSKELQNITRADIDGELRFLYSGKFNKNNKRQTKESMKSKSKSSSNIIIKTKNKTIAPRSPNQQKYLENIKKYDMVFGLGPAGTGKTYLAVAAGVDMYLKGEVERLIFCRPAVEAGENLGFLPGDMKEKIDPYLRPIYDALQDMLPWDFLLKKMEIGEIEIAPLAFMRGRTLSHAFVILDEAQNATSAQMKMFLTRMGEASHMIITGDATQSDLPYNVISGLSEAINILKNIDNIGFTTFDSRDVIRHSLVRKIIHAYDDYKKGSRLE